MIRKVLDCSVQHVSAETRERLDNEPSLSLMRGDDGWLLYVPQEPGMGDQDDPPDLLALYTHARALGCECVLLDRDADYCDGLQIYEDAQ